MIKNFFSEARPTTSDPKEAARISNAILVTAVVFMVYVSVAAIYLYYLVALGNWQFYALGGIALSELVFSSIAFHFSRTGRSMQGMNLLLISLMFIIPAVSLFITGLGIALGIGSLVGFYLIATLGLPADKARNYLFPIIISSVANLLIDFYIPTERVTVTFVSTAIPVLVLVGVGIFAIDYLRGFANYPLRTKLIISFISLTVIPIGIFGFIQNYNARTLLTEQIQTDLTELSTLTAQTVDTFITTQLNIIRTESQQPTLRAYLEVLPNERADSVEENAVQALLTTFARKDPVFIHSYAILDKQGRNLFDTFPQHQTRSERSYPYFLQPLESGEPYASGAIFTEDGEINIFFSAPIRSEEGDILGILRAEYNIGILQNITKKLVPVNHPDQLLTLVDKSTFVRVAYTGDRAEKFRSYKDFNTQEIIAFQIEGRMLPGSPEDAIEPVPEMVNGLSNLEERTLFTTISDSLGGPALSIATSLSTQPWYAVALQSEKTAFTAIEQQQRFLLIVSLIMAGLAAGAGALVTNILVQPVTALTGVAQKISAGDLNARAEIGTNDEIGTLGSTLNQMATELNRTLTGLEERVAERTTEMMQAREQSEKRATQLTIISEVSRAISGEQNLDRLLPLITRLMSEKFGFYHVGIFLVDQTGLFAVLLAANSDGGQRMLARGHRLGVGQTGIVGYVSKTGNPRIALDVGADATFFNNPDLPQTHSEMALPLKTRGKIIGVLDVQSTETEAFSDTDINLLSVLADQVAITIDNAQLFGESQRALSEVQSLYNQFTQQEWGNISRHLDNLGYLHTLSGGKELENSVQTPEMRAALQRGEVVVISPRAEERDPVIAMPVKLRNQVIGVMNVKSPYKNHVWTVDEINMVQAVSDRLALSLENARLFSQAQRRAATERAIGDVSSKLSASTDIDDILRLTVEEIGKLLKSSEVAIQIGTGKQE